MRWDEITGEWGRIKKHPEGLALGSLMIRLVTEEGQPAKETMKEWVVG